MWSFAQEVYVSHQLSEQASALRRQDAALQAENDGYRRDIAAMASGAAAEEEARLNGYARGDEKLYLVSAPPPEPAPARATVKVESAHDNPLESFSRWLNNRHR